MKRLNFSHYLLGFLLILFSCDQAGNITPIDPYDQEHLISKDEATQLARDYIVQNNESQSGRLTGEVRLTINEIKGSHNKTAIYIVNNEQGGWQVIAGSKVDRPILAYSLAGEFGIDIDIMNEGLKMWIGNTLTQMVLAYYNPDEYKQQFLVSNPGGRAPGGGDDVPPPPPPCEDTYSEVLPLVVDQYGNDALFDQDWPENMYTKLCSNYNGTNYNGRGPVGCVPVAMAQVMWYYKSPSRYNWNILPRVPTFVTGSSASELETGNLFKDITDQLEPWYFTALTCSSGTGAFTSTYNNLDKSYDWFGYDAYEFTSAVTLKNEITALRPVIAVGGNAIEEGRHVWVIDGRKSYYFCDTNTSYLYLHCNWGWGASYPNNYNGWFGINGYTPGSYNFNDNLKYFKIVKR